MTPAHTRKRQFQPSNQTTLNSYLGSGSSHSQSPPLPAEVQSSLISVGMRVRKSVPEGYKTHKTLASPGFPFPSSAPPAQPTSSASVRPSLSSDRSRELMPFCGLHSTGGSAAQHLPPSSAPAAIIGGREHEEVQGMPDLSLSQTTTRSTQSSFTGAPSLDRSVSSKKRGYEDEVEDDMDAFFDQDDMDDATMAEEPRFVRPIAKMRSSNGMKPQSNTVHIVNPDDFEEASFLVPMVID